MDAIVRPHTPIVVGIPLGVLAVLVVEENDHLFKHFLCDRKARTKSRARELESEVGADTMIGNEILKVRPGSRGRVFVKLDPFVDVLVNRITHCGFEMSLSQTLAHLEIALIEKFVAWNCYPIDVAKPAAHAHARTVLGIVEIGRDPPAPPQLRE